MIFYYTKRINDFYSRLSSFGRGKEKSDWDFLDPLMDEIWGKPSEINWVLGFLEANYDPDINTNSTGMNDVGLQKKNGFIAISFEWYGDDELLFPEKKFRQFIEVLDKASKVLLSDSMYETPDRLKFTIDDEWNTRIEGVFLNADISFFERDGSGRPQFRFERVKGHQYRLVQNDCADDPASLVLGTFIEDVWKDPKILIKSVRFKNGPEDGVMYYGKTFLKKEGMDHFILGLGKENNLEHELVFSEDVLHRILVLNELFLNSVPDAPLDKLPGVIYFTFDEYWNLIPVPLFRPADKNFVDKE